MWKRFTPNSFSFNITISTYTVAVTCLLASQNTPKLSLFAMRGKQAYSYCSYWNRPPDYMTMCNAILNVGVGQEYYTLSVIVRTSIQFISMFWCGMEYYCGGYLCLPVMLAISWGKQGVRTESGWNAQIAHANIIPYYQAVRFTPDLLGSKSRNHYTCKHFQGSMLG